MFVGFVRRCSSTNIDEQVPATRATHDEQRRTSTNNDEHRRTIFFFPPTTNIDEHFVRLHTMPRGYDSSHFLRTENSFGIIWPSPRQLRVKNTLRVGHRGPVGRKTTQKPPQNTKKWKKIVKKRLFSRFGHFGQNSDFSRKKSKTGIFFDITKPPLAQIYPKSGL